VPDAVKPVILDVSETGVIIVVGAGLVDNAVQRPETAPTAAIPVDAYWQIVWSDPAFGLAVTCTCTVSVHPFAVHTKPYMPATVNPVMGVVALLGFDMEVLAGFVDNADQVPVPAASITAAVNWQTVSSGPALPLPITFTIIVSVQPLTVHMKPYAPLLSNPLTVVLERAESASLATDGLDESSDQTPVPTPASVAIVLVQTVSSAPAFGFAVTLITTVSLHSPPSVHTRLYAPGAVKPVTVVVGELIFVNVTVAGLPARVPHSPVPIADMVADEYSQMVWSDPALARDATFTITVSVQPFTVHTYLYAPVFTKLVIVVVADEGVVILVIEGLPGTMLQVPVPTPAIVTVVFWQIVWSGPALGLGVTVISTVSEHGPAVKTNLYTPEEVKPVIVVVGEEGLVIVVSDGFVLSAAQDVAP
jgi:hypothetical protein